MQLTKKDVGKYRVVAVNEPRIDAAIAISFKDKMREITAERQADVVLDLVQVDFIDSSGLGSIVAVMKQLDSGAKLLLAGLSPTVEKVFRLTRMDSVFSIFPDVEAAVADAK